MALDIGDVIMHSVGSWDAAGRKIDGYSTVTGKTFERISMDFFLDTKHKKKQMWQILQFKRGPIQVTRLNDPNLPNKNS
jgi:hypothetical protein